MSVHIILGLLSVCVFLTSCQAECPYINGRAIWGARQPTSVSYRGGKAPRIIVKSTKFPGCFTRRTCPQTVRTIQNYDMLVSGKPDIHCSFVIGGDGQVYEGRGWDKRTDYYDTSLVYCLTGKFDSSISPNSLQISKLQDLLDCASIKGKVTSSYTIQTPRDIIQGNKDPGESLYILVKSLAHYKAPPQTVTTTPKPVTVTP